MDTTTLASTTVAAQIDGSNFASGTINLNNAAGAFACETDQGTTHNFYFDDVAINDTTGTFNNSWCGAGSIIYLKPSAAGDSDDFTTTVGGTAGVANNYTRVQEVTPDDASTYNADTVTAHADFFTMDDTPVAIGSGDTITVVQAGIRYSGASASANANIQLQCKQSGGSPAQGLTITPASTSWVTNANAAPFNYSLTMDQDPSAVNWTKSTLDTIQLGYKIIGGNTNAVQVSTIWLLVDSTPAAAPAAPTNPYGQPSAFSVSTPSISIKDKIIGY